jgi:diamine N-acetyltransferase
MSIVPVTDASGMAVVVRLARSIWADYYTPLIGEAQVEYMLEKFQSEAAISDQIRQGFQYFLLRAEDGREVGYFAVVAKARELFLSKLYVATEERRKGYARKAVEFAAGLARAAGLPRITLTVNKRNDPSLTAYRRLGFAVSGAVVTNIGGGFVMDDYQLSLAVGSPVASE